MTMLAEVADAVIGIDSHRDSHEVEIADPAGRLIATMRIGNDSAGSTRLLTTIAQAVPGPRVAVCIEGSRSYRIGLARALAAAGLLALECEQPSRRQRLGKGKSDPIDAHLAVLAGRGLHAGAPRDQAVRHAEIQRLALALAQAWQQLRDNRAQLLLAIVEDIAPGLTSRYGVGPVSAAQAVVSFPPTPAAAAARPRSPLSVAPARSQPAVATRSATGSTAATALSIAPFTPSRWSGCAAVPAPVPTSPRRTAEGKTAREIRRCLKRYLARGLCRQLTRSMNPPLHP